MRTTTDPIPLIDASDATCFVSATEMSIRTARADGEPNDLNHATYREGKDFLQHEARGFYDVNGAMALCQVRTRLTSDTERLTTVPDASWDRG